MKPRTFLMTIVILTGNTIVFGQDSIDDGHQPNRIEFACTSPKVAKILQSAQQDDPQNTPVPKFVIKSQNNNFIFTIGGELDVIMGADMGNNLYRQSDAGISFTTSAIPVPAQRGHKSDFYINPISGSVVLQVIGFGGTDNQVGAFFKVGTNGVTNGLNLKRAYITWRGLTAGMKQTLFQDGNAEQPPTIDPEGPSGCVSHNVYGVSYTSRDYNGFSFALAIDIPSFYSSNGYYRGKDYPQFDGQQVANYADAEQNVPDIPVFVQYQFSTNNRIRLSAILRNFAYRDLVADKTRHMCGWGVQLSGNVQPSRYVTLYYQAVYGKGIGAYLQDIAGHPLSFVPYNARPGRMHGSPMLGANIGVSYNPTSKLQFNAMFSQSRLWDVADYANALSEDNNYKYALYGAVNCFYNITPYLQWGIEYLWGRRQTWNIGGANDNRLQTQIAFTF